MAFLVIVVPPIGLCKILMDNQRISDFRYYHKLIIMKKLIGFLGLAVVATFMMLNSSVKIGPGEINLASLMSINEVEAEGPCVGKQFIIISVPGGWNCISGGYSCCPLL